MHASVYTPKYMTIRCIHNDKDGPRIAYHIKQTCKIQQSHVRRIGRGITLCSLRSSILERSSKDSIDISAVSTRLCKTSSFIHFVLYAINLERCAVQPLSQSYKGTLGCNDIVPYFPDRVDIPSEGRAVRQCIVATDDGVLRFQSRYRTQGTHPANSFLSIARKNFNHIRTDTGFRKMHH